MKIFFYRDKKSAPSHIPLMRSTTNKHFFTFIMLTDVNISYHKLPFNASLQDSKNNMNHSP